MTPEDFKVGDRVRGLNAYGEEVEGVVREVGRDWLSLEEFLKPIRKSSAEVLVAAITSAQKVEVTLLMGADEARDIVGKIREAMDNSRAWLAELHEREGWKALGYKSWRECVMAEFGQSQAYLYRQLAAAQAEKLISPDGEVGQIPEAHLRPLSKVPETQRAEVWQEAVDTAPAGKVTGEHVASVVRKRAVGTVDAPDHCEGKGDFSFFALHPMPMALVHKMQRFLQDAPGVEGARSMPPRRPWSLESRVVNLIGCPTDLEYWIEVALANVEEAAAAGSSIRVVLWVPAFVDRDWFRRLAGNPTCFVTGTFWEKCFAPKLKYPTALVLLLSQQVDQEVVWKDFVRELREVGYVWS